MRIKFTLFTFLLVFALHTQAQQTSQRTIDAGSNDFGNTFQSYKDTIFIIGTTNATTNGDNDALFIQTDRQSNVLQNVVVGGTGNEFGTAIAVSATGNFSVVGRSNSYSTSPAGVNDVLVVHVDSTGNLVFLKVLGTDSLDYATVVREANDGGIILGGRIKFNDRLDGLVVKMSNTGVVEWSKNVGTTYANEVIYDIRPLGANMGYLVAGYSGVNTIGLNEASFSILNNGDGSMGGTFLFGGTGDDDARMIANGPPGKFFILGNTRSFGAGMGDIFVARFDLGTGIPALDWFKTYGGANEDAFTYVTTDSDNNLVVTGITSSFGQGGDALAFKIDANGSIIWAKNYGGSSNDAFQCVISDGGTGYSVLGYSNSFTGTADNDLWILDLDKDGISGCNESVANLISASQTVTYITPPNIPTNDFLSSDIVLTDRNAQPNIGSTNPSTSTLCSHNTAISPPKTALFEVYPIPTSDEIHLQWKENMVGEKIITLYNTLGEVVLSTADISNNADYTLNLNHLSNGIYTLVVNASGQILCKKVVLTK